MGWRAIVRITVLWSAGLVAGMIIGGLIGDNYFQGAFSGGIIAGAAVFTCVRLWVTEPRRTG